MKALCSFAAILLTGLLVGAMFGIWLGYNPTGVSGPAYVEVQQAAIRGLNLSLPLLGAVCILLSLLGAFMARDERAVLYLYLIAAALFIAAGLITRFLNQPINAIVITWNAQSPPPEWTALRDEWWRWHIARTIAAVTGFALLIAAGLRGAAARR